MTFNVTSTHESKVDPSVRYVVRTLSKMERARRDLDLIAPRAEVARLFEQTQGLIVRDGDGERFESAEDKIRFGELDARIGATVDLKIKPVVIRAGLVSISGLVIDGQEIQSVEEFINRAPESLFDEAYELCEQAAGLTREQQKNSPSLSTSPGAEADQATLTTVENAFAPDGT